METDTGLIQLIRDVYAKNGAALTILLFIIAVSAYELIRNGVPALVKGLYYRLWTMRKRTFKTHLLFKRLDTLITYSVPNMNVPCPLRRRVFQDLLLIKYKAVYDVTSELVAQDVNKMPAADFKELIAAALQREEVLIKARAAEAGIPGVVVEHFYMANADKDKLLRSVIIDYTTTTADDARNSDRLSAMLELLGSLLVFSFSSVEHVVNELNGEISSIDYKGVKCPACQRGDCGLAATHYKNGTKLKA